MSAETDAQAILTALNAALAPTKAYDRDEIPATVPARFVVIDVSRRFTAGRMLSGDLQATGGRLTTRYAAQSVTDARRLQELTRTAIEEQPLPAPDGATVGPFLFEAESQIARDDRWFTAADTWTY